MLHVLSFSVVYAATTKSIRKFLRALRQMQQRITHYQARRYIEMSRGFVA